MQQLQWIIGNRLAIETTATDGVVRNHRAVGIRAEEKANRPTEVRDPGQVIRIVIRDKVVRAKVRHAEVGRVELCPVGVDRMGVDIVRGAVIRVTHVRTAAPHRPVRVIRIGAAIVAIAANNVTPRNEVSTVIMTQIAAAVTANIDQSHPLPVIAKHSITTIQL